MTFSTHGKSLQARTAFSLIELLVAIGIVAVIAGLIMSAIVMVRSSASCKQSVNKLRQLIIAMNSYSSENPNKSVGANDASQFGRGGRCPLYSLCIYIDGEPPYDAEYEWLQSHKQMWRNAFINSSDESLKYIDRERQDIFMPTSYVYNMTSFNGRPSLTPTQFSDGLSTTIAYAEKNAHQLGSARSSGRVSRYRNSDPPNLGGIHASRRASFADKWWDDPYPVTDEATHVTRSSIPGMIFDKNVPLFQVTWKTPRAFHSQGLNVAMFDGSVHTLHNNISEAAFYGMLTRNANDNAGFD